MTERKPPEISFASWIDQQINEATERGAFEVVRGLNQRIMEWRRIPLGPPIFLPLVGEETMVRTWRDGHSAPPSTSSPTHASRENRQTESPHPRWWHRLSRGRRRPSEGAAGSRG
jgi:hypothetical protein